MIIILDSSDSHARTGGNLQAECCGFSNACTRLFASSLKISRLLLGPLTPHIYIIGVCITAAAIARQHHYSHRDWAFALYSATP